jgi:type IV pilus assembly protein PilV
MRRPAAGFTLVEVLVALVVLAIGLLGVAKLFVVTIRGNASATSRLYAVNLAADLADRIRANRTAGIAYAGSAKDYGCIGGTVGSVQCSPAQLAATDLSQWQSQISALWPSGASGSVTYVGAGAGLPATYTVTVAWLEAGTGQSLSYTLRVII